MISIASKKLFELKFMGYNRAYIQSCLKQSSHPVPGVPDQPPCNPFYCGVLEYNIVGQISAELF
jgi:hypothetical protein